MNKILSFFLLLSSIVHSNEISFYEIKDSDDQSSEISFLLDKVSFIKSYSLEDPSRIVIDVYQREKNITHGLRCIKIKMFVFWLMS